jgi:steroid delta-isomerase-like uncharacterized protein
MEVADQTLDLISRYVRSFAERDATGMDALRADDYRLDLVHRDAFVSDPLTAEQTRRFWPSWFASFPDMDYHVHRTLAAEPVALTQWTFTGTNDGPLTPPVFDRHIEATGRTVRLRGATVYEVRDGLIRRETTYIDLGSLLVELGITL